MDSDEMVIVLGLLGDENAEARVLMREKAMMKEMIFIVIVEFCRAELEFLGCGKERRRERWNR